MEIRTNVVNQIKLLKMSTFKDPFTFVDENIQNAQRAGAENMHISVDGFGCEKTIRFFNDGEVLEDLQKLFILNESGWNEEVTKNENPFGIGFFSNIAVASRIKTHSGFKTCCLDITKIIENNDLVVEEEVSPVYVKGFELILEDLSRDFDAYAFKNYVNEIGKHIMELKVFLDSILIKVNSSTTYDGEKPFFKNFDNDLFLGYVYFSERYSDDVVVYYKGRKVTTLPYPFYSTGGELHLKDGALDLTAPDRKAVIENGKYYAFKKLLKDALKELALENINHPKSSEYADAFLNFASKEELAERVAFEAYDCDNKDDFAFVDKLMHKKEVAEVEFENSQVEEITIETIETEHIQSPDYTDIDTYPTEDITEASSSQKDLETLRKTLTFYVLEDELKHFTKSLATCKRFGISIVIARNSLMRDICREVFKHLRDLSDLMITESKLEVKVSTPLEQRANDVFLFLSKLLGENENIFALGDLEVREKIGVGEMLQERIKPRVAVTYNSELHKILVDKSFVNTKLFKGFKNKKISLQDFKFILRILPLVAPALGSFYGISTKGILEKIALRV